MPEREKVIQALENCVCYPKRCQNCPWDVDGEKCSESFSESLEYPPGLVEDALALLKEQEARVMTREEMIEAGKNETPVYVEECPKGDPVRDFWGLALPGIEPPKDKPFNYPGGVDFNAVNSDGEIWDGDFYGMNAPLGWRAWTSRPTPEQMRDTKWGGENETV